MVIYLLNELIDGCQLNSQSPTQIQVFEAIADSYKHNFHFLIGDREVLEILSNNIALSDNARGIYNRLSLRYSTLAAILDIISFTYKIGNTTNVNDEYISININDLLPLSFLGRNTLLIENPNDTFIYDKMISQYLNNVSFANIEHHYTSMNGGGNTISSEFDRLNRLKQFFSFCLVDSDKISPHSQLGATASEFVSKQVTPWGKFLILPVHEIENLIPKSLYISYIQQKNDGNLNNNLQFFQLDNELFYFLDTKKGINKSKLRAQQNPMVINYYLTELGLSEEDINCSCPNTTCNCHIIYPFGRPIFNEMQEFFIENGIDINEHLCARLSTIYFDFGKKMFEIFCKPQMQIIL